MASSHGPGLESLQLLDLPQNVFGLEVMGSRMVRCQRDGVVISVDKGILEMDERSGREGETQLRVSEVPTSIRMSKFWIDVAVCTLILWSPMEHWSSYSCMVILALA